MEFRVLGPLEVETRGAVVPLRRGLPSALLIGLVLRLNETVVADVLVDWLWPEGAPANPANALQVQVSYLRKTLGLGSDATRAPALVTRAGGYALLAEPSSVDRVRFEDLLTRAGDLLAGPPDGADARHALSLVDEALALWRGHPLADAAYAPFAQGEVARLEALRLTALQTRNEALLALGRHAEALGDLRALAVEHPLHEPFHAQLVLALYRAGRQADALQAYEQARAALVDGLGLDPGPELRRLEQAVLRQDPELDWTPPGDAMPEPSPEPSPEPAPAAPRDAHHSRLPAALEPLVGRDRDLQAVSAVVADHRLVTLTGPGGAGKTTLAIEVARRHERTAPVWLVELAGIADDAELPTAVAAELGVPTPPDRTAADVLVAHFADRQGLLVLDNCEHVIDAAAPLAATLVRRCPGLRVLATSRQSLGVAGERVWPVPPLGLPDAHSADTEEVALAPAVALFVRRARGVRPDFALDEANAAAVAAICRLLDGLPLAIELAAARVDLLAPDKLLERLDDRFRLLVGPGRDTTPRQRSLAGAIAWSHDLLSEDERLLFARLGVFGGPFPLEAAVAVAGEDIPDPLEVLASLVRQSLVHSDGASCHLLESLRAFALERLRELPGEETAARERHATWYTTWSRAGAKPLTTPEQGDWLVALRAAMPNLREALAWSFAERPRLAVQLTGALSWFWAVEGMFADAHRWLERAAAVEEAPEEERAWALFGAGMHAASLGQLERAHALCRRAVDLFARAGKLRGLANSLLYLGVAQWGMGELEGAAATHDEALECFTVIGDAWGQGMALFLRSRTAVDRQEPSAPELLARAEEASRAAGDSHVVGLVLDVMARAALERGELADAERHAAESLALHESVDYQEGVMATLHCLAAARLGAGAVEEAWTLQCRGLRLALDTAHPAGAAEAAEGLAAVCLALGRDAGEAAWLLATADDARAAHGIAVPAGQARRLAPLRERLRDIAPLRRPQAPPLAALAAWAKEHAG